MHTDSSKMTNRNFLLRYQLVEWWVEGVCVNSYQRNRTLSDGRTDQTSVTKKVRQSNHRTAGHFGTGWQLAVLQFITAPDVMEPYAVLLQFRFQGHGCRFPAPCSGP